MIRKTNNSLTIDLGTTNTKITLWKDGQHILKKFVTPKLVKKLDIDFNLELLWKNLIETLKSFSSEDLKNVNKISIASFGESGILLDSKTYKPVGSCVAWFDKRAQLIIDSLNEDQKSMIYKITGLPAHEHYSACKISWEERYDSDVNPNNTYIWLCVPDYLVYKLTGNIYTENSIASRTLCLDIRTKTWSRTIENIFGIENVSFPKIKKSGESFGTVTGTIKHLVATNCTVTIAGHDHMCGSICAQLQPKELLDSTGTTEALMTLVKKPDLSSSAENYKIANGLYIDRKQYTRFSAMPSAGSLIEWFINSNKLSKKEFEQLSKNVFRKYKDNNFLNWKVIFIPHFNGSGSPYKSTKSLGMIYGLSKYTSIEELIFGLYLGLCFEFLYVYRSIFKFNNINKIKVIGPAIKDPIWLQLKADLLKLEVDAINIDQAVSEGAYILCTGNYINLNKKLTTYFPTTDDTKRSYLLEKFAMYQKLYNFKKENKL